MKKCYFIIVLFFSTTIQCDLSQYIVTLYSRFVDSEQFLFELEESKQDLNHQQDNLLVKGSDVASSVNKDGLLSSDLFADCRKRFKGYREYDALEEEFIARWKKCTDKNCNKVEAVLQQLEEDRSQQLLLATQQQDISAMHRIMKLQIADENQALLVAAQTHNVDVVKALFTSGKIRSLDLEKTIKTILSYEDAGSFSDVLQVLLDQLDEESYTIKDLTLHAVTVDNEKLLYACLDKNDRYKNSALRLAIENNRYHLKRDLIARGADQANVAVRLLRRGNIEAVERLLEEGLDINDVARNILAVRSKPSQLTNKPLVEFALSHGLTQYDDALKAVVRDKDGFELMKRLLDLGATDVDGALASILNYWGTTCFDSARAKALYLLRDKKARPQTVVHRELAASILYTSGNDKDFCREYDASGVCTALSRVTSRYKAFEGRLQRGLSNSDLQKTNTGALALKYREQELGKLVDWTTFIARRNLAQKELSQSWYTRNIASLWQQREEDKACNAYADVIVRTAELESQKSKAGYVMLVQGRNWSWNFYKDVANLIEALKQNSDVVGDKVPLRSRKEDCDTQLLLDQQADLVQHGTDASVGSSTDYQGKNSEVVFANLTPLSNLTIWGECAARYFLANHSCKGQVKGYDFALQLLHDNGLSEYEFLLKELIEQHKKSSDYGELLAMFVHKDVLGRTTYVASPQGGKYQGEEFDSNIYDNIAAFRKRLDAGYFDTDKDFHDADKTHDRIIYCLAAPDIPGHKDNPEVHSVISPKDKEYRQYKKKLNETFQRMKKSRRSYQDRYDIALDHT